VPIERTVGCKKHYLHKKEKPSPSPTYPAELSFKQKIRGTIRGVGLIWRFWFDQAIKHLGHWIWSNDCDGRRVVSARVLDQNGYNTQVSSENPHFLIFILSLHLLSLSLLSLLLSHCLHHVHLFGWTFQLNFNRINHKLSFRQRPAATGRRDSGGATVTAATYHRRNFKISNN
jgi:hypothetical protein